MTNPRTGYGSIDLACVGAPHLPTSGRPRPRIACHHCLNLDQWESLMASPKARNLSTNFKAMGHRRFEQHACNVETLTWSVSDSCPGVRVGPNQFRHDLVASLDPREQVQLLERARPISASNQPAMTMVDDEFHLGPTAVYSTRQVNRSPVFCEPLVALPSIWLASMNNTIPQLLSVLRRSYARRLGHTTRMNPDAAAVRATLSIAMSAALRLLSLYGASSLGLHRRPIATVALVDEIQIPMRNLRDLQASGVPRLRIWS